jgi:uncharacterized protein YqgV (UPF0045/DUF77 family)
MTKGRLEFLVEPFKENDPGPHVVAVMNIIADAGLIADMGPFSTTVDGDLDALITVLVPLHSAGFTKGATSIQARISQL